MVNFDLLKEELGKFNGKEVVVSMVGKLNSLIGIECCKVMNSVNKRGFINIVNMACLMDNGEPISIILNEEDILDYEILECCGNSEVMVKMEGQSIIIVGC